MSGGVAGKAGRGDDGVKGVQDERAKCMEPSGAVIMEGGRAM